MANQKVVDRLYIAAAARLAARGLSTVTRNNPRVGCILVNKGEVVGRGWHAHDGGPHAEVHALEQAGNRARGSTCYVTLEPCCWEGRTSACTAALIASGVKCVVVGGEDPHVKVSGQGLAILRDAAIQVRQVYVEGLDKLNPGQRTRMEKNRPYVRIKSAISVDGRTAVADGESQWITGTQSRKDVQSWRARSGAVLTGIGTVLADDPRLTVRDDAYHGTKPWRVILDTNVRLPHDAALFEDENKIVVVCGSDADPANIAGMKSKVDFWQSGQPTIRLDWVLQRLAEEGVNELLVEAGETVVGGLISSNLWDEMVLYLAPKLMGSEARALGTFSVNKMAETINAQLEAVDQLGEDVRFVLTRVAGDD